MRSAVRRDQLEEWGPQPLQEGCFCRNRKWNCNLHWKEMGPPSDQGNPQEETLQAKDKEGWSP